MRSFVVWVILLAVGYLAGFVPQFTRSRRLQQQTRACKASLALAELRQSAALMYVQATQLNYGNAAGYAQQFFDQAGRLATTASDAALRNQLENIVASRDKVMADLAKGSSAAVTELQPIVLKIEQGP